MGFKPNPFDICVCRPDSRGAQCNICIHVDDLMITFKSESTVDEVCRDLEERSITVNQTRGSVHSYLGMTFDFSSGQHVKITMSGYVNDVLRDCHVTGTNKTPAANDLYNIRDKPPLPKSKAEEFHSRVAKLLYIAKHKRPDILQAVIFLSSRVQASTQDDADKLDRVLRYLNYTMDLGIVLHAETDMILEFAYIVSSFGIHPDYKGHTGIIVTIGEGPIFVKSTKQKIVAKSSTKAERIGISEILSMVIQTRIFLIQEGYKMDPATVFQEDVSIFELADKGRSTSERTRPVNIRHFISDRIVSGETKVVHKGTRR